MFTMTNVGSASTQPAGYAAEGNGQPDPDSCLSNQRHQQPQKRSVGDDDLLNTTCPTAITPLVRCGYSALGTRSRAKHVLYPSYMLSSPANEAA